MDCEQNSATSTITDVVATAKPMNDVAKTSLTFCTAVAMAAAVAAAAAGSAAGDVMELS
jgi:hypothetical protein